MSHRLGDGGHCGLNTSFFWTCVTHVAGRQSLWWVGHTVGAQNWRIHFDTLLSCIGFPPRTHHTVVTLVMTSCARQATGLVFMWRPDSSSIPWLLLTQHPLGQNLSSLEPWGCLSRQMVCLFFWIKESIRICVYILTFIWMHCFSLCSHTCYLSQTDFYSTVFHIPKIYQMSLI